MKIAVGLSGGVDSSVAALLLRDQGHEVTGITMRLWRGTYRGGTRDACYGPGEEEDIARARRGSPSTGAPVGPVTFADGVCHAPGEGLFGVAPGQSAVFYDADGTVLCGGIIRGPV